MRRKINVLYWFINLLTSKAAVYLKPLLALSEDWCVGSKDYWKSWKLGIESLY